VTRVPRFRALARAANLPPARLNAQVTTRDKTLEVDALWPDHCLVVELDGAATHHTLRAFHEDRARDAALAAHGYTTIRLTWDRVTNEPGQVAEQLRRALEARTQISVGCEPSTPPAPRPARR
jgi:very-short-patch-repair endonuclease